MKAKDLGNIIRKTAVGTAIKGAIITPIYAGVISMGDTPYVEGLADSWPFVLGIATGELGIQYFKHRKEKKQEAFYDSITNLNN